MLARFKQAVKRVLALMRASLRRKELERKAPHVTRERIASDLRALGIQRGDTVFLHSSLKNLGFVEGGPEAVLRALMDAVGPDGTLIVPTYWQPGGTIYSTCLIPDYEFDPRRDGSNLGALPSAFLNMPDVRRSIHPTHSVSAWGRHADHVTSGHHSAPSIFGAGSPWDRCVELGGKVLGLGVSMGPITFYHLLEDRMGDAFPLPVRMNERFELACRDWDGRRFTVPVVPLDLAFMPRRIDSKGRGDLRDYFWREFEAAGLLHAGQVGAARSWTIEADAFYRHLRRLADEGITIYATAEELARRPVR